MSEFAPRCPHCGQPISIDTSVCPACGREIVPHRERIRCNHCGRRILADMPECPRCGADPYSSRFPFLHPPGGLRRAGLFLAGTVVLLCVGWIVFRAITTQAIARTLGWVEPTPVAAQVVQIIYVVATSSPPTPTMQPTVMLTPTPQVSPSPTRRGAHTATPARPTATPVPPLYAVPQLIGPANATVFNGPDAAILLEWQPISGAGLAENEWYRISMKYTDRNAQPAEQIRWSKETRWTVPPAWWNDASPDARTFKWNVMVVRAEGVDPFASRNTPASPASATRSLIWN